MSGSNLDRIAALEKTTADLAKRLAALEKAPPQRDPASTTGAHVERAVQFDYDRQRPASFGFARMGPERPGTAREPIPAPEATLGMGGTDAIVPEPA